MAEPKGVWCKPDPEQGLFMICLSICKGQEMYNPTMVARQFFLPQTLNPSCDKLNLTGKANQDGVTNKPSLGFSKNLPYPGIALGLPLPAYADQGTL